MTTLERAVQAGLEHHHAGRLAEAEAIYRRILADFPHHAGAWHLLGAIALQRGQHTAAIESVERAIQANPQQAIFYNTLGEAHRGAGQILEAQAAYRRAIELDPQLSPAHNNLGLTMQTAGEVAAAQASFERTIQLAPQNVDAHFNLSCVLLLQGQFEPGWREYAARRQIAGHPSQSIAAPQWDGSPLPAGRLLLYAEQGLGDTLQFIRYLPLVRERAEPIVAVQPKLIPLLNASGFEHLVSLDEPLPACDAKCSLLDLPGMFATTLATIPAAVPYLRVDGAAVERWRGRLASDARLNVGIVWQGNPAYYSDRFRSIPLREFAPLAELAGVRLISLQTHVGLEQIDQVADRFEVVRLEHWDAEHAFADAAAVMRQLDLVITSDTAAAHLAGGLSVPVWLALGISPSWRWLLHRDDSPWYPSMRLFRQTRLGQWSDVFAAMADAITEQWPR